MDWAYLAIGGFLLGAFLYTGAYTIRYEPAVAPGYLLLGFGICGAVIVSLIADITSEVSDWWRGLTLLSYCIIAAGLILIARERSSSRR